VTQNESNKNQFGHSTICQIKSKSLRKSSEKSSVGGTSSVGSVSLEQEAQLQTDFSKILKLKLTLTSISGISPPNSHTNKSEKCSVTLLKLKNVPEHGRSRQNIELGLKLAERYFKIIY
jgi:hypothetical protein